MIAFDHQRVGVTWLTTSVDPARGRTCPRVGLLGDEPGAGKTKQAIDAANVLWKNHEIETVIVLTIAEARPVWYDPDPTFGEIAKHRDESIRMLVEEYHARPRVWTTSGVGRTMRWIVSNYEFVRNPDRLRVLLKSAGLNVLLILDESAAVRNQKSAQYKAALTLRRRCGWVWELNGTPIAQNPGDLYAQMQILDPRILSCQTKTDFLARYAIMGGFKAGAKKVTDPRDPRGYRLEGGRPTQVMRWINLDDLQHRVAPYVLRRLKKDCLDLPPKLPPSSLTVTLTAETWKIYRDLRAEALAWLDAQTVAVAPQAGVKIMRLAQVTSGTLGGIERVDDESELNDNALPVREVGREKLDFLLEWLAARLTENASFKVVVWCRFRAELDRLHDAILDDPRLSNFAVGTLKGGQNRDNRMKSLRLLNPQSAYVGAVALLAVDGTGATGVNLAAADNVVHLSHGNSLFFRIQGDERVHRPGQVNPVSYWDVVAYGPRGQKTIDHVLVKAMRAREDLANWTCAAWVSHLSEED